MSHSILASLVAVIGAVATDLMHIQERTVAQCAGGLDPRDLPDHLRRDIGLADGRIFGAEAPARPTAAHWSDHVQTRQAS